MTSLSMVCWIGAIGMVQPQDPQFTPGEVVLRFRTGTVQHEAVGRAAGAQPPDLDALRGMVDSLGRRVAVPLRMTAFGSGGWVVLAVQPEELARSLANRARSRSGVASAEEMTGEGRKGSIAIRFEAGSPEAAAVKANCLDGITRAFEKDLGVGFAASAAGPDTLVLSVDLKALTLSLVQRLKQLAEVEEAQPNFQLRPFRP